MNEANDFYQEMRSQKQTIVNWRDDSGAAAALSDALQEGNNASVPSNQVPVSGNGELKEPTVTAGTRDGIRSQTDKGVNLTPNG
jgi:autophagy-related protein 16-1